MKPKILIVDDDEAIRTQMKWALSEHYEVHFAEDRKAAVEGFEANSPAVTLLDLGLPPRPNECDEGLAVLSDILAIDNTAKVIIISGQSEKQNAIEAVGAGAYDFLCKPVEMEELRLLLRRCIHVVELEKEYHKLQQSQRSDVFEDMLGTSPQMQAVFDLIRKVAGTNAPVLLLGESGTGKEMAAAAIHRCSARKDGPFVAINCNAIPENLLESELFGHEKGSFTGAHVQRKGLLETANGGTLFLDEIGELPPAIQVKLLRFLQEQRLQRVGGRQEIQVDTRLVAATNADLKELINSGKFREDLYFRLAVVTIRLLPLRERGEDIVFLAREFLQRYAGQNGQQDSLHAGRVACDESLFMAWKCPRTPKPRKTRRHYGKRIASERKRPRVGTGQGKWQPQLQQRCDKHASTSNGKWLNKRLRRTLEKLLPQLLISASADQLFTN